MSAPETRRVLRETLAYIQHHRLAPGDRLPSERELAERMTVGRGAVREALTALETVRLVERRANAGFYVRDPGREGSVDAMVLCADFGIPLSRQQVRDAVEMRRILELQAVKLACERRVPADLERLRDLLGEAQAQIDAGRPISDQDAKFHQAIVEATHNEVFGRMVHSFYLLTRARREVYFRDARQCRRSHAQHKQIFAAIDRGDAVDGTSLLEKHFKGVETFWLSTLTDDGSKNSGGGGGPKTT